MYQRGRGLRGEAQAEQRLRDCVVEFASDALAFLDESQLATLLEKPGVGQRDRRMRRQHTEQPLVVVGELGTADRVREVNRTENLIGVAAGPEDRDTEERAQH